MDLTRAIGLLADVSAERYEHERIFAAAYFSGWLNSPDENRAADYVLFAALCHATAALKRERRNIPSEWINDVFDHSLLLSGMDTAISFPIIWYTGELDEYNNCNYTADIVRFMISFKHKGLDKRDAASLSKAWEFINKHGGFGAWKLIKGDYWTSYSQHQITWRKFKKTSPFQYVRYYQSELSWFLDPRQPDFWDQLISFCENRAILNSYFRKSLFTQMRFKAALDTRSMGPDDWVAFPEGLNEEAFRLQPMPGSAYDKLRTYTRKNIPTVTEDI